MKEGSWLQPPSTPPETPPARFARGREEARDGVLLAKATCYQALDSFISRERKVALSTAPSRASQQGQGGQPLVCTSADNGEEKSPEQRTTAAIRMQGGSEAI